MVGYILEEWRDRHFWALLLLSLVVLFCAYRITLPLPLFINVGTEGDERYLSNFYLREQSELYPFRWTKDSSYVKIPHLGSLPLEIVLAADAPRPEGHPLPQVALIANGTVLADFTMQNVLWAHRFLYHPPLSPLPRDLLLEIKSDTFVPPGESRALGIILNTVELKPVISTLRLIQVSFMTSLMGTLSIAFSYLLLRWLGVSQKKSLVCGIVVLAFLGLGVARRFIVARCLVGVFGLLLVGYILAILLEVRGYREPLITRLGWGRKTLETWADNLVSVICNSIKTQALSPHAQSSGLSGVLPAYLPAVVLFILMPFALYLPNQSTFDNNLILVIPYLVLAVIYFVFLIALLLVGQPLRTGIVVLLFYIGLYLGLSDIVSPIQLGELMGGRETPQEPLFLTAAEVVLAVVVIVSAIKLPWRWVKRFGSIFVLLLLISEAIVVLNGLSRETSLPFTEPTENVSSPPEELADGGNIYHITFDSYSSARLLDSLETMGLTEDVDGFTFFKNNRANYGYMQVSVPSYMTGSFYKENDSLKEWQAQHKSSGIVNNIYNAGYEVSMYTPYGGWWIHENASHVKMHKDVLRQYKSLPSHCHFADLWLLRVVPNFLQQEVYREGKGVFTRWFVKEDILAANNARVFGAVELMRQLLDDEANRPDHGQYVYAHLLIPHSPYVMNRDCVFSPDESDHDEQALCATRLMAELTSKLKELGRYHKSTIIFQADHGISEKPCSENASDCMMSSEIEEEIEAINLRNYSAKGIDNITRALLLIKPPLQSRKPLVILGRPTQLADIPATLYDLLGLPVRAREGESVFSPDFPEIREIHMFIGLIAQKIKMEKNVYLDKTYLKERRTIFLLQTAKAGGFTPTSMFNGNDTLFGGGE